MRFIWSSEKNTSTLLLICNTELDKQEHLENYLELPCPEICHMVLAWKITQTENKNYLCKPVMWEWGKVKI